MKSILAIYVTYFIVIHQNTDALNSPHLAIFVKKHNLWLFLITNKHAVSGNYTYTWDNQHGCYFLHNYEEFVNTDMNWKIPTKIFLITITRSL